MSCPQCGCQMYSHREGDSFKSIKKALGYFKMDELKQENEKLREWKLEAQKELETAKAEIEELKNGQRYKTGVLKNDRIRALRIEIEEWKTKHNQKLGSEMLLEVENKQLRQLVKDLIESHEGVYGEEFWKSPMGIKAKGILG